jgi:hypothetical protein
MPPLAMNLAVERMLHEKGDGILRGRLEGALAI